MFKENKVFCIDCKFFDFSNYPKHLCSATAKKGIDYITGKERIIGKIFCIDRNSDGNCKFYKPKVGES